jgi:hypothetical protein
MAMLHEILEENGLNGSVFVNEIDQLDQAFLDAKPVKDLEEYITFEDTSINEELLTVGDGADKVQFQLDKAEILKLKTFLKDKMKKLPFDPMKRSGKKVDVAKRAFDAPFHEDNDWKQWVVKAGYPENWDGTGEPAGALIPKFKMGKLYNILYSLTKSTWTSKYINFVIDALKAEDPKRLGEVLFSISSPPKEMDVPKEMLGLADIGTAKGGSKGSETGRGEFVVPFLFKNGRLGGSNATHDVNIEDIGWHVKEITSEGQNIRLGLSTYSKSDLSTLLKSEVGMSGGDLSVKASKRIEYGAIDNLYQSHKEGKSSIVDALNFKYGGIENGTDALYKLQEVLDTDMKDQGIGSAAGVLFFVNKESTKVLHFVDKEDLTCGGATQGAHTVGKSAVGPFARAADEGKGNA